MAWYPLYKGNNQYDPNQPLPPNRRMADGHLKSAIHEDHFVLTGEDLLKALKGKRLKNLDTIQIHVLPTMSVVHGFGISVYNPVAGLKMRVINLPENMFITRFKYDPTAKEFVDVNPSSAQYRSWLTPPELQEIGSQPYYYRGVASPVMMRRESMVAFEIMSIDPNADLSDLWIETRLHVSQPCRPPVHLGNLA